VSKTFDAFPFPRGFAVISGKDGSPPQLRFKRDEGRRLAELADMLAEDVSEDMVYEHARERLLRDRPIAEEINVLMLRKYELRPDATDLDILERLVDANQRQA